MDIAYSNDKGVKQSVYADSTKTSRLKEFVCSSGVSRESGENKHKDQKYEDGSRFLQGRDPPRVVWRQRSCAVQQAEKACKEGLIGPVKSKEYING